MCSKGITNNQDDKIDEWTSHNDIKDKIIQSNT